MLKLQKKRTGKKVFNESPETAGKTLFRVGAFGLFNALLFAAFSVLWVRQYHMAPQVSDTIDNFVVPWLWLAAFFGASFSAIRRPVSFAILVSLGSAIALAGILFLFIHVVLVSAYDPMF